MHDDTKAARELRDEQLSSREGLKDDAKPHLEIWAHLKLAKAAGLDPAKIEALRKMERPPSMTPEDSY